VLATWFGSDPGITENLNRESFFGKSVVSVFILTAEFI